MKHRLAALAWALLIASLPVAGIAQTAASAASAVPAAPAVDPAVEATAKEWLHRFQTGEMDPSQFDATLRSEVTPARVRQVVAYLAPLGEPTGFTFLTSESADGATSYHFTVTFASSVVDESLTLDADGKIEGVYFKPDFASGDVRGRDVEYTIANGVATLVRSLDPHVSIGAAACPAHLDLSDGRIGHCTLIVQGRPIPLVVVYDANTQNYRVDFDGVLYGRSKIEAGARAFLRNMYSIGAEARCDMAIVSVLKPGNVVRCHAVGRPKLPALTVVLGKEDARFEPLPGMKSNLPFIDDATIAHKHGKPVVLTGAQLGAFVDRWIRFETFARESDRKLVGKTRCPSPSDLTANNAVVCAVPFDGRPVRYSVSIDDRDGFDVDVLDAVIAKASMVKFVTTALDSQLQANGAAPNAKVTCGPHRLVIRPAPGYYYCRASLDGQMGYVRVIIENNDGRIHIGGLMMDNDTPKKRPHK